MISGAPGDLISEAAFPHPLSVLSGTAGPDVWSAELAKVQQLTDSLRCHAQPTRGLRERHCWLDCHASNNDM